MKKLLLLLLGRWRILCDLCPWCKSKTPETCPVCKHNTLSPPPKEFKELWWIRYSAKIKLAQLREEVKRNPVPTYSDAWKRVSLKTNQLLEDDPMDQLFREYIIPGVTSYKNLHGFYPPSELRFLENLFPKPEGILTIVWTSMLVRLGNAIKKMEDL